MFDKDFIDSQKEKLLKEKERIISELDKMTLQTKTGRTTTFPEYGQKEDENALEIARYEERLGISESLENLLDNIEKSLKKIEEGTYGICEKCGGKIEKGRLEVYPEAIYCVTCSQKLEKNGFFEKFKKLIWRKK